ncbi:hypothetical protein VTO58DRAFT_108440 [Aureobasidium pullulans]
MSGLLSTLRSRSINHRGLRGPWFWHAYEVNDLPEQLPAYHKIFISMGVGEPRWSAWSASRSMEDFHFHNDPLLLYVCRHLEWVMMSHH